MEMNTTTNQSLLLKLRSRSEAAAWSQFVKLYAPLVHKWVGAIGIKEPDRSDVAQDVFVVLLGKMSTFQYDPKRSFRGWLRTITLNKCRDRFRARQSSMDPVVRERMERAVQDDSELLTENEYRTHLANSALKLMREHFSDTTWRACWAHVAEGRPAHEIALEFGISENAVYLARARVLKRLRIELEGLWD